MATNINVIVSPYLRIDVINRRVTDSDKPIAINILNMDRANLFWISCNPLSNSVRRVLRIQTVNINLLVDEAAVLVHDSRSRTISKQLYEKLIEKVN